MRTATIAGTLCVGFGLPAKEHLRTPEENKTTCSVIDIGFPGYFSPFTKFLYYQNARSSEIYSGSMYRKSLADFSKL